MSGRCYEGAKNSMWANDWGHDSSPLKDTDTAYDGLSQISDVADDQGGFAGQWDVKERMKRLFEMQSFTDVTFYPKNNRKLSISAHRAVLAIGSPLFTKMLFGDQSKDTTGMKMEVQISNMPFDAFTNIVKYLYTDEVYFENDLLVQGILDGAKQFGISRLVNRCKQYFETLELTDQNVCEKLQLSISNKINTLKERCIEFIQRNTFQAINSAGFQNCSPNTVKVICKLQSLNLRSEMDLLEGVMKWLYAQPPQSRKQMMDPLLKCIRFLTFSVAELGDTLKKYPNLLTSDEGLKIMLYLYNPPKNPDFKSLPSWCNKNITTRCFPSENECGPNTEPNAAGPKRFLIGKVFFPLKPDYGQTPAMELTSLLQMRCISGYHEIKAIKLMFDKRQCDRGIIGTLTINIHVHPSGFKTFEVVQIVNSDIVRVEFKKCIKARRGDLIDIEAEAKNIKFYRFLQFDDTCQVQANPHFQCCVSSRPKQGKLYFINEIEYGPQDRNQENFRQNFRQRPRKK